MTTAQRWTPTTATRATRAPARRLWTIGPDTVIADSAEHAWKVLEEHLGGPEELEDYQEMEPAPHHPSERVIVGFEDEDDLRDQLREAERHGADLDEAVVERRQRGLAWLAGSIDCRWAIKAPASWWAQLPSGFLCSEEW